MYSGSFPVPNGLHWLVCKYLDVDLNKDKIIPRAPPPWPFSFSKRPSCI